MSGASDKTVRCRNANTKEQEIYYLLPQSAAVYQQTDDAPPTIISAQGDAWKYLNAASYDENGEPTFNPPMADPRWELIYEFRAAMPNACALRV